MVEIKTNKIKPLDKLLKDSRNLVKELMDSHFKDIEHDEERKIVEMKFFLKTFEFIRKKWNVRSLYELEIHSGMNFNEMMRHMKGISSRSLSDRLKQLEDLKLITRTVQDARPPKVFYELSEKGQGIIELIQFIIVYLIGI
ncbi:MAG: helix-turn-helix transcriptional regulator [Candidatus Lokiarchaeota archaeon]|nr:helix-turn-helix transcriptional regulator [Candidatus Lokiarchaeota archaeon]